MDAIVSYDNDKLICIAGTATTLPSFQKLVGKQHKWLPSLAPAPCLIKSFPKAADFVSWLMFAIQWESKNVPKVSQMIFLLLVNLQPFKNITLASL